MIRRVLVLLTLLLPHSIYAQSVRDPFTRVGSIRIHVNPGNGRACDFQATVSLVSTFGSQVAEEFTNTRCEANFVNVASGSYHVTVSGAGIEVADSRTFDLESGSFLDLDINVNRVRDSNHNGIIVPSNSLVAVADLSIPQGARKELDKANQFIAKGNFQKAIDRLNKAIAIHPDYAEAYNNLGVVYGRLGDRVRNLEALQKALSVNDHFAPAYLNLAGVAIADRDFSRAEVLLNKATAMDPADAHALLLLAGVELVNQHYEQALAICRQVHSMPGPHAVVHLIAARIFEHENLVADALAQLQVFLSEEQSGVRADEARKEMIALRQRSVTNGEAR